MCTFSKNEYVECSELYIFFEKLCTWIYRNIYIFWKIVDVECTKLVTFFEKCVYQMYRIVHILIYVEYIELCTLNVHNCVYSLKICICWMYNIVYIIWKNVYVKYTELWTFLKKLCTLNVHSMKDCVYCLKNGFFNCTE